MEELLNKLIEKGWKPFDVKGISEYFFESVPVGLYRLCWKKPDYDYNVYSKRDLVSKESGLWQFCCENKMIRKDRFTWMISPDPFGEDQYNYTDYRYRIIESALRDEEDLEQFLLDNIKVDG